MSAYVGSKLGGTQREGWRHCVICGLNGALMEIRGWNSLFTSSQLFPSAVNQSQILFSSLTFVLKQTIVERVNISSPICLPSVSRCLPSRRDGCRQFFNLFRQWESEPLVLWSSYTGQMTRDSLGQTGKPLG